MEEIIMNRTYEEKSVLSTPEKDDFWQTLMPASDCSVCPFTYAKCKFIDSDLACWEVVRNYYHANYKRKEGSK